MRHKPSLLIFSLFFFVLTFAVSQNSFFWDTIHQASKHAQWYYENNFSHIIFPDSGNPPLFGIYLAVIWKIFGKSLIVSHFAMLPLLIGIVFQLHRLILRFFQASTLWHVGIMLVLISEATLLGQSALVSPDIALVFFYLLCMNEIMGRRQLLLIVALIGLASMRLRGSMAFVAIFIIDLLLNTLDFDKSPAITANNLKDLTRSFLRVSKPYVPAALLLCSWYAYHYVQAGWFVYHPLSPWKESFTPNAGVGDYLHSIKMLIWLFLDYGKAALWISLGAILWLRARRRITVDTNAIWLFIFVLVPFLIISPTKLIYVGLMGSRYYLPVFIFLSLFTLYLVFNLKNNTLKYSLYSLILTSLITGHLWVYPERLSQNWDGTLAHLPYYELRKSMINYIDKEGIPYESIGTTFPNLASMKYTDLTDDERTFSDKDLSSNKYVFYSNVFNEWTVDELAELHQNWEVEREFSNWNIYVKLYKNPKVINH